MEVRAHEESRDPDPLEVPGPAAEAPRPVPYRHQGSTYDQDSLRITGSRAFIDAVLSRLTALLAFVVWWGFLIGHILNDIAGFGS